MGIRKLYRLYLDCYYRGLDELKAAFSVHQMRDFGGIAQLGERLHGMQEVSSSILLISTN